MTWSPELGAWLRGAPVAGAVTGKGGLGPSWGARRGQGGTHGLATWVEAAGQARRHLASGGGSLSGTALCWGWGPKGPESGCTPGVSPRMRGKAGSRVGLRPPHRRVLAAPSGAEVPGGSGRPVPAGPTLRVPRAHAAAAFTLGHPASVSCAAPQNRRPLNVVTADRYVYKFAPDPVGSFSSRRSGSRQGHVPTAAQRLGPTPTFPVPSFLTTSP